MKVEVEICGMNLKAKKKKKKKERKKPRISAKHKKLGEMHGMDFSSEPLEGINS